MTNDIMMRYAGMFTVFAIIWLLPLKLMPRQLMTMAGIVWALGGLSLLILGVTRLVPLWTMPPTTPLAIALGAAVVIGIAKGKFVLSKTAGKNIVRLQSESEPLPLRAMYAMPSWIIIALMIGLSMTLNLWGEVPVLVRGSVNVGIGLALLVSSLRYFSPPVARSVNF
ncbi:MAG: hypothetical protein VKJ06_04895 [Vampirovibrionales bacterium]|nr:hypothetical protein [Vampirovibrionales bacterium]